MKLQTKEDIIKWIRVKSAELTETIDDTQTQIDALTEGELIQEECDTTELWENNDRANNKQEILLELLFQIEE